MEFMRRCYSEIWHCYLSFFCGLFVFAWLGVLWFFALLDWLSLMHALGYDLALSIFLFVKVSKFLADVHNLRLGSFLFLSLLCLGLSVDQMP